MRTAIGTANRTASFLGATLILLAPALWNRFPILEYDTGGYLTRWFEGTLVPSRSTTYGLFLTAGWPLDFWPIVILQAAAAVWIVGLILRVHRFDRHALALPAVILLLSLTTAIAWLASELLTDIFAGLAILGFHALVRHGDRIAPAERLALVVFVAFAASTHSGTYAVLLGLALVATIASLASAELAPRHGVVQGVAALVIGAVMLVGANYVVGGRLAWTPGGYGLIFARLLQDGIVSRYLDAHCPNPKLRLCPYRDTLPRDADTFLWGGDTAFDKLGRFAGLDDEMRSIVLGSLRDYPGMQIKTVLIDTAHQLAAVGTGYGVLTTIWHTYGIIARYVPSAVPAMRAARQQHGELGFAAVNAVNVPVAWIATALLPLVAICCFCSVEFIDLGVLAATLTLALLGNAAFCAAVSHWQNRYGSRLVWIAVLTVVLAAWRALVLGRRHSSAITDAPARKSSRESASTV